ncbi:uncharacterized protein TNIN_377391 [Trichonephila inaurata madagascariensis]|uniref:Uncharacterized protein n=1 Tax=Trichonephila inaurata madagascariensis TaxID=2747483 RepID=A0A8X6YGP5_9ARAC|nr:uncharacterized protein TNIN_377391 [Trichonephila inaurata madagascariensis]
MSPTHLRTISEYGVWIVVTCAGNRNESNKVVSRVDEELSCPSHEEADTKMVYHACNINYPAEIVIRSVDTDIAAIMVGNMHPLKNDSVAWMLTGTGSNLRYVDLTKIHAELGQLSCQRMQF